MRHSRSFQVDRIPPVTISFKICGTGSSTSMCTYVPRCAPGGQLDYLDIHLHDLWEKPIHDDATVRCCTRSSVSPARRFLSKLRHWHIDDLVADTANAENEIVMRQSTENYMDTNCRNPSREERHQGARNKFVTSFRTSYAHQNPGKWWCRKISRFQDASTSKVETNNTLYCVLELHYNSDPHL